MPQDAMKMICDNKNCTNKAVVYRKFSSVKEQICNRCKKPLATARNLPIRKYGLK